MRVLGGSRDVPEDGQGRRAAEEDARGQEGCTGGWSGQERRMLGGRRAAPEDARAGRQPQRWAPSGRAARGAVLVLAARSRSAAAAGTKRGRSAPRSRGGREAVGG